MDKRQIWIIKILLIIILLFTTMLLILWIYEGRSEKILMQPLRIDVEKELIKNWDEIPNKYLMKTEKTKLIILPHIIMVYKGSDVVITAFKKNNTITIIEKEVLGKTITSLGQLFKISETIDLSVLPMGNYTIIVKKQFWNGMSKNWETEIMLQEELVIQY